MNYTQSSHKCVTELRINPRLPERLLHDFTFLPANENSTTHRAEGTPDFTGLDFSWAEFHCDGFVLIRGPSWLQIIGENLAEYIQSEFVVL